MAHARTTTDLQRPFHHRAKTIRPALALAQFVTSRQEGTKVFYSLANEHARQLVSDAIFQAEHSLSSTPRHHHAEAEA